MNKTYIIDGNSLLFRSYYSNRALDGTIMRRKDGLPTNAIYTFHNLVDKLKSELEEGDHLFIAFDTEKKTHRREEFEEYKAQRKAIDEDLAIQLPIARELLDSMDICWAEKEGFEADDLCGSLANYACNFSDVYLFTSDKDFLQLASIKENIYVCLLKKGLKEIITYDKNNMKTLFGLEADQITDYKALAGDSSDNYPGVKGIGEKTAIKLLTEYSHIENMYEKIKNEKSSKMIEKLLNGEKECYFFKSLATIDTSLDMKDIYEKSIYTPYHKDKLLAFYHKYEFNQMIKNIDKRKGLITEEKKEEDKLIVENITSINNLKNIRGITFVSNNDNENIAELLGFALLADKVYFLPLNYAYEDEKFKEYLNSSEQKITYDLKSLYVFLERYSFPKVKNVYFDLLLATYLLNPDVGQSRDEIFSNYSISLGEEKYCSSLYYTGKLEEETIKKLEDNDQLSLLNNIEIPLSEILASMEIEGVPVDKKTLEDINKEYSDIIEKYKESIYADAGLEFNINSPKVLEDVLFNKLNIYRRKGEKGTNIEVLNRHIDDHPIINKIIAYRTYNKIVSSYTSSLPKHIFKDNKIHAIYNQALTATGRLSMSEPNLQNISIKNELGKNIRKAFFYPDDNYFLSLDYSQIELRVLASIGNIPHLIDSFIKEEDIHKATASKVFNVPLSLVDDNMRRKAKAVNFGIVYGITKYGLAEQLHISSFEAEELINAFKESFPEIQIFEEKVIDYALKEGYVKTLYNRRRYLPLLKTGNHMQKEFSKRAAVNTVIQGTAADLIKVAMKKCYDVLSDYKTKIILQIHDELIFKVPKDELEITPSLLKKAMESAGSFKVPLKVDGTYAKTWYEVH